MSAHHSRTEIFTLTGTDILSVERQWLEDNSQELASVGVELSSVSPHVASGTDVEPLLRVDDAPFHCDMQSMTTPERKKLYKYEI